MEYLKRVLGIKVRYENETVDHLPNFIRTDIHCRECIWMLKKLFFCILKANWSR